MHAVASVSVLVLAAGLAAIGCARSEREGHSGGTVTSAARSVGGSAEPRAAQGGSRPAWAPETHYRYRLHVSSQVSLNQGPLYDFDVSGVVNVVMASRSGMTQTFHLTLEDAALKSRIPGTQPEFDKLLGSLKRPFFFELERGLVSATHLPADLHPLAASVFRSISAALQFAEQPQGATFSATEYDTTGQYVAEYSPGADSSTWTKRKQRYVAILLAKDHPKQVEGMVPRVVKSEGKLRVQSGGALASVEQVDELHINHAQAPVRSRVELSLKLEGTRAHTKHETDFDALKRGTQRLEAGLPFMSSLGQSTLDDAKMRGMTFEQIVSKLRAVESAPSASAPASNDVLRARAEEQSNLFIALGAVLRRKPETVARVAADIRAKSKLSDVFVDALGNADTPEAQATLAKIAADASYADTLRNRAAISLSRTEHPTADSVKALLAVVDDEVVGTQALYGLGAYCKIYQVTGRRELATKLGEFLIGRLKQARSELRASEALRALANAAYMPALAHIEPLLSDPRKLVRVDAVRALQAMPTSSVEPMLVQRLEQDSARAVKLAAIEAMDERAPSDVLVDALRRATTAEDPHVRYRAVEMLVRWLPKRGELREALQAVAKNDQEEKIRSLAGAAL